MSDKSFRVKEMKMTRVVREIMTESAEYVREDETVLDAAQKMKRLDVIDGHKLVGIVSQGDLATELGSEKVGELVGAISS